MVGETSSYVEADASGGSIALADQLHLSETLANSVAVPTIVPTVTLNSSGPITIAEKVEIKEEPMPDTEMVYGTYDEATNCITIIYPEEDVTRLSPISQQQQPHLLHSPSHSYESLSPTSLHSEDTELTVPSNKFEVVHSDAGYESHGSPASSVNGANNALTDLWHESFSELFPSLAWVWANNGKN